MCGNDDSGVMVREIGDWLAGVQDWIGVQDGENKVEVDSRTKVKPGGRLKFSLISRVDWLRDIEI